jgi:3-dehydroquinate dehydratase I
MLNRENNTMVSIGTCMLGSKPCVAVAIRDDITRADMDLAINSGADIAELRIDQFSDKSNGHVLDNLKKYSGIPRLGTVRMADEGGSWEGTEQDRLAMFNLIIPEIEAVDIELNADQINRQVIEVATCCGKTIIGSFHNFQRTPGPEEFQTLMAKAVQLKVDIVKIAAQCSCMEDVRILAGVLLNYPKMNLIVLGMGIHGTVSRFLFPALGSLLNYTFLGQPTAPGQMNMEQTLSIMKAIYPQYT